MTLLLSMFPFYLLGNLHCLGMCGPLVVMLGKSNYRYYYFIGRLTSFSLAGGVAGLIGQELNLGAVQPWVAIALGALLVLVGLSQFFSLPLPRWRWLQEKRANIDQKMTLLLLQGRPTATFLFGMATVLLPCGQSFLVFSACALSGSGGVGLLNGAAFALLTSPSLLVAMHAHTFLKAARSWYRPLLGITVMAAGLWMGYRGLADLRVAPAPCSACERAGRR